MNLRHAFSAFFLKRWAHNLPGINFKNCSAIMCCWQGHKIKNPRTLISTQLRRIPVAVAVIISGTPIQNNLMELFALFDFVHPVKPSSKSSSYSLASAPLSGASSTRSRMANWIQVTALSLDHAEWKVTED